MILWRVHLFLFLCVPVYDNEEQGTEQGTGINVNGTETPLFWVISLEIGGTMGRKKIGDYRGI